MKKLVAVLSLLFVAVMSLAADVKPGSIKAPGKGKVVIVGRSSFKNPIDFSAYEKVFAFSEKSKAKGVSYSVGDYSEGFINMFTLEEPFYYTAKVDKDGCVTLPFFQICLYQSTYTYFRLPLMVKVRIPEGASYVYVGNFQYDLDYALRVVGFNHYDEFDAAQGWINTSTGKDCELYRGELEFLQ